ncbi:MAG: transcription elongation factor GreA, partial [Gammaproteobacteria bacterium]|nr:transcription elongation factor GreA [Gammaproteobacteria bacterium]
MGKVPMTVRGEKLLRDELLELKTVTRPRIIADIATAREHGDLKENAEYHAAKEEQAKIESRVIEINDLIARA